MAIDVQVGANKYYDIERFTTEKLKHLHQRARGDVHMYQATIAKYPPLQLRRFGLPYLAGLEGRVKVIAGVLRARNQL